MTKPTDFRRYGLAWTGTRPVIRLGDPGIDAGWLRRYRWGAAGAAAWLVLFPVLLAVGLISARGPFGALDAWQLSTFGSNNVILLVILFMPLAFLPLVAAHLLPVDATAPALLGVRQAFDPSWGPRVAGGPSDGAARLRRLIRAGQASAVLGAAATAFFAWKGFHDAAAPHAPIPQLRYEALTRAAPLPHAVRLTGAVADRSRTWTHPYSVRQDEHVDVWYALRPTGVAAPGPAALVELDETSPQYAPAPWNSVDAPGPREGLPRPLDDWTADQLRRVGIALAPRVVVLERRQLHGRDPRPDPLEDYIFGMFGFVALLCGLLFWWSAARAARRAPTADPR